MPVAEKVAEQILCLPIYPDLDIKDVKEICHILTEKKF